MKKLAGTLFVYNGKSQDYCYIEAINSLLQLCEHTFVVDAGSNDGTAEEIWDDFGVNQEFTFIRLDGTEWRKEKGKEKLNYFTNIAIRAAQEAGYEYQFNLQSDEIIHEKSYPEIMKAINTGAEGFMTKRINLWKTPFHQLNVPHDKLPCSTEIVRLAKTNYRSYGDAESVAVDNVNFDYLNKIDIWHYGFVRDKKIMKDKVIHMQEQVFGVDHDKKLDGLDYFEPDRWFNPNTELKLIDYPHPHIMKEWIKTRP